MILSNLKHLNLALFFICYYKPPRT